MHEDIRRWSDELARDPASLVFLPLGDALRKQGNLDFALKVTLRGLERHPHLADGHDLLARIAVDRGELERAFDEWDMVLRLVPGHVGALKGIGFVCWKQGRFEESERYLATAAKHEPDAHIHAALETARASAAMAAVQIPEDPAPAPRAATPTPSRVTPARPPAGPSRGHEVLDAQTLFAEALGDAEQTALLLDAQGLVLAGSYLTETGEDVAQEIGAELSGVSDEATRAARHLALGAWKSIVFETHAAVAGITPTVDDGLVVVVASRTTPLGLLRRVMDRCADVAGRWLAGARQ